MGFIFLDLRASASWNLSKDMRKVDLRWQREICCTKLLIVWGLIIASCLLKILSMFHAVTEMEFSRLKPV